MKNKLNQYRHVLSGVFLAGFLSASTGAYSGCQIPPPLSPEEKLEPFKTAVNIRTPSKLTAKEMEMAKVAWQYFINNYNEETGLVNAVNNYPSTTMWDTASYLGGLIAAYEFGIVDKNTFDTRLVKLFATLNKMDFFRNELPNKVYHTKTAEKVDYANQPGEIGFSALDLGRMLVLFKIIKERYPYHANAIDRFVLRWDFRNVLNKWGLMYGAVLDKDKKTMYVQEGRLGYEEYAAKGFQLWGFNTQRASLMEPYQYTKIYDVDIPYDTRDPRKLVAHNYVVTESYVLDAIELGWDLVSDKTSAADEYTDELMADFAKRIYAVQEARYRHTGIITARTEHQLDQAPYFVYDTIYTDGFAWNTITEDSQNVPQFAAIALKGALGLWGVWDTPYTQTIFDATSGLYDEEKGFYEGLFENGSGVIKEFTANNNGIILETLLYKTQGKLLKYGEPRMTLWEKTLRDDFDKVTRQGLISCVR